MVTHSHGDKQQLYKAGGFLVSSQYQLDMQAKTSAGQWAQKNWDIYEIISSEKRRYEVHFDVHPFDDSFNRRSKKAQEAEGS